VSLESINPATGRRLRAWQETSPERVSRVLESAATAFRAWSALGFRERAAPLRAAADILRERRDQWARLMAEEMGKPLAQGVAEAEKCAAACRYFAEQAEGFLSAIPVATDARESFVTFCPLGVLLAIMPWNFPFWQVFRAAAPAVMAGNVVVLKHASNVCGCSAAIASIFEEAGFPRGVFASIMVGSASVDRLAADPRVQAVTLTGSTEAGRSVARAAGASLKKCVLELGGSDPYVVLEDADLAQAAALCAESRLINSGQSCIAAKRFIVVESARRRFEELLVSEMGARRVGDPLAAGTAVGPLAREDLRRTVSRQVEASVRQGARLLLGGSVPAGPGFFYPPTVLTDVRKGMPAFDEEVFGPAAAIVPVGDEAGAIAAANDTSFGLGAAIFTRDVERGRRIAAERLEAGNCFVNAFVRSDARLPFGGVKGSGFGRELSAFGIREFVNVKTVFVG
jgi:succinate-semialdehyde dehydrogenase/glutarate-semialdehyde dehydrogenase